MDVPNWRLEDILHFKYLLQNDSEHSFFCNNMDIIREHVRKTEYQAWLYAVNTPIVFTAAGLRY